jgi:hypothetical protein
MMNVATRATHRYGTQYCENLEAHSCCLMWRPFTRLGGRKQGVYVDSEENSIRVATRFEKDEDVDPELHMQAATCTDFSSPM